MSTKIFVFLYPKVHYRNLFKVHPRETVVRNKPTQNPTKRCMNMRDSALPIHGYTCQFSAANRVSFTTSIEPQPRNGPCRCQLLHRVESTLECDTYNTRRYAQGKKVVYVGLVCILQCSQRLV